MCDFMAVHDVVMRALARTSGKDFKGAHVVLSRLESCAVQKLVHAYMLLAEGAWPDLEGLFMMTWRNLGLTVWPCRNFIARHRRNLVDTTPHHDIRLFIVTQSENMFIKFYETIFFVERSRPVVLFPNS